MEILEACYEINFKKIDFLERKVHISNKKSILYGPPKSGKSYLLYDYLSNFNNEEYLYIDFSDIRVDLYEVTKSLQSFIEQNSITILALDNFDLLTKSNMHKDFTLPKCNVIIITTAYYTNIDGFDSLEVMPLDFEEYILFDKKHQNITNSFNYFLKYGNLPETLHVSEQNKTNKLQELIKLISNDKTEEIILKILMKNSGEKKSIFQLFNSIKKEIKISKNRFYAYCSQLEQKNIIFQISKYNQPKAAKKIFTYNHAFCDAVTFKKNFNNVFSNMIFLELYKNHKNIYYLDNIDFFIEETRTIVLAIPFFSNLQIASKTSKILPTIENYNILNITIITIGIEQSFYMGDIECEVVPFYEWALGE